MKNRSIFFWVGIAIILLVAPLVYSQFRAGQEQVSNGTIEQVKKNSDIELVGKEITVIKSPNCGCCAVYASYLKKEGLRVSVENVTNTSEVKDRYEIPTSLRSCHTSIIDGYVVEGHIPVEAIKKLLSEKPSFKGIAMPGMPVGSPGMPGNKEAPFEIYKLGEDGIYMSI